MLLLNGESFQENPNSERVLAGKITKWAVVSNYSLEQLTDLNDCYTPFFFPRSMWNRFWAQNVIPHQTSARMTHLKVCMIIISCVDITLHFNVFITTHVGALVKLWKGGTTFEQLRGTKMKVWQPFIPTWMAKSGEPFPGNLKVWMSERVHFRSLFPKLAKNYSCYEGEHWHWINE